MNFQHRLQSLARKTLPSSTSFFSGIDEIELAPFDDEVADGRQAAARHPLRPDRLPSWRALMRYG